MSHVQPDHGIDSKIVYVTTDEVCGAPVPGQRGDVECLRKPHDDERHAGLMPVRWYDGGNTFYL